MSRKKSIIAKKRRSTGRKKALSTIKNAISVCVVIDTREKDPWKFERSNLPSDLHIKKIFVDKLDAGDYTIVGFDLEGDDYGVVVERKNSLEEFIGNIGRNWDRFKAELEKMSKFHTAVIVVEDDMSEAYKKYNSKGQYGKYFNVPPSFIIKRVAEIQSRYGIPTYFFSNKSNAERFACNLFKNAYQMDEELDG